MAANTKIEWSDDSVSFWWGCTKVSSGCTSCYAQTIAERFAGDLWGATKPRLYIRSAREQLRNLNRKAKRAGQRRSVFINSMSDFFEDHDGPVIDREGKRAYHFEGGYSWHSPTDRIGLPPVTLADLRRDAFRLFDELDWLDLLLLTKRPENIRWMMGSWLKDRCGNESPARSMLPVRNVWLGTSIATQDDTDIIEALLDCRDLSPVLFLSCEPLLGPINLHKAGWNGHNFDPDFAVEIDWVIVGCESNGKRVGRLPEGGETAYWEIASSLCAQCQTGDVAFFHKQGPVNGRVSHDPAEWPVPLPRQFPNNVEATP